MTDLMMHPAITSANVADWRKEWETLVSTRMGTVSNPRQSRSPEDDSYELLPSCEFCTGEPILSLLQRICMFMFQRVSLPVMKRTHNAEYTMRDGLSLR